MGLVPWGDEDTSAAVRVAVEGLKLLIEEDRKNGK